MADIKKKGNITIKTLDRTAILSRKLKENIVNVKDKTKESYEITENSSQEYAENKMQNQIKNLMYYGTYKGKKIGRKSLEETKENIKKGKQTLNKIKGKMQKVGRVKKVGQKTIKTANKTVKATQKTIKTADRTARATIKTTKQAVKTSGKVAQRTVQMAKATAKATIHTIKVAIKVAITTAKAIITATKALVAAITAGGWVAVVIVVVICLIAMICSSIFGIFFSSEKDVGDKTMSSVIREINAEFTNKITDIQKNTQYEQYEINSNRAEWKEILIIYAVAVSNGEEQTDIVTLDDKKINKLKEIFWQMNIITSNVKEVEKNIEVTDENGNIKIENKRIKVLYIDIDSKSVQEMIDLYNFNSKQVEQIAELQKDDYNSMWSYVVYGSAVGSNEIVQVALAQVGNIRTDNLIGRGMVLVVVLSGVLVLCRGVLMNAVILKQGLFLDFQVVKVKVLLGFKLVVYGKKEDIIQKHGDIIFFDWAESNDGKADHVGIVERIENDKVYTIEGNSTGDTCRQKEYDINSSVILGYGTPMY